MMHRAASHQLFSLFQLFSWPVKSGSSNDAAQAERKGKGEKVEEKSGWGKKGMTNGDEGISFHKRKMGN